MSSYVKWCHLGTSLFPHEKFHLMTLLDIVSLELFEDFLGLKLHLFDDFLPSKSSKRCYFLSLKLTYFEDLLCFLFFLLLTALLHISMWIFILFKCISLLMIIWVTMNNVIKYILVYNSNILTQQLDTLIYWFDCSYCFLFE